MAKRTQPVIFLLLFLLVLIVSATGFIFYKDSTLVLHHRKEIHITASQLYDSYSKDSLNAERKYNSKILLVNGEVFKVFQNAQQQGVILLETGKPQGYINCTVNGSIDDIKPPDHITIKGICSGLGQGYPGFGINGDVYLTRCLYTIEKP